MATEACIVSGLLPATVTSVDLTKTGFGTPDCAIIYASGVYDGGSNPFAGAQMSIGFWSADSASEVCFGCQITDAVTVSDSNRVDNSTKSVEIISNVPSSLTTADASAITDGIRITVAAESTTVQRKVSALLIKGNLNSYAGYKGLTTASAYDITDPGFKPDLVFIGSIGRNTINSASTFGLMSLGVAHNDSTDTVTQAGLLTGDNHGQGTSVTDSYFGDGYCVGQCYNGSLQWRASLGSFDASGFTLTTSTSPASDYVFYLAIELADPDDAFISITDTATSTGNEATTGAGFAPDVVGFLASQPTASNTVTGGQVFMRGWADDAQEWGDVFVNEDVSTTTDAHTRQNASAVVLDLDDGTADARATVDSFDSDGWTLNYSAASGTARKMVAFAIGDSTASGATEHIETLDGALSSGGDMIPVVGYQQALAGLLQTGGDLPDVFEPASVEYVETLDGALITSGALHAIVEYATSLGGQVQLGGDLPDTFSSAGVFEETMTGAITTGGDLVPVLESSITVLGHLSTGGDLVVMLSYAEKLDGALQSGGDLSDIFTPGTGDYTETLDGALSLGGDFVPVATWGVLLDGQITIAGDLIDTAFGSHTFIDQNGNTWVLGPRGRVWRLESNRPYDAMKRGREACDA